MTQKDQFIKAGFCLVEACGNTSENKLVNFLKENYPQVICDGEINVTELKSAAGLQIDEKVNGYGLNFVGRNVARAKYAQKTAKELKINKAFSKNFDTTQNMILKGDNLDCLKILKSYYSEQIKCIYIDPPYNTAKNEFIYPDKFDREEQEVLGLANISENDFERLEFSFETPKSHNGWLSFMYPRLMLARDLLAKDGVIFISIDDNEQANLRLLCNEIFGEENSLDRGTLIWNNAGSTKGFTKIVKNHEYILCYAKNEEIVESCYGINYLDGDDIICNRLAIKRSPANPICKAVFPKGLKIEGIKELIVEKTIGNGTNRLDIIEGKMVFKNGILVDNVTLEGSFPYRNQMEKFLQGQETFDTKGQKWLEVYFTSTGHPYCKKEKKSVILGSVLEDLPNSGSDDLIKLNLKIDSEACFPNPKPVLLIDLLLRHFTKKNNNDIVLDFFAGSGTTGQAVMQLNAEDGGNRKFILCQIDERIEESKKESKPAYKFCAENNLPPVISSITCERVKRAGDKISKEIEEKNAEPGMFGENKQDVPDVGFKVFDLTDAPKLEVEEDSLNLVINNNNNDPLSRIYNMIFSVGIDNPTIAPECIVENCMYKTSGNYYITNADELDKAENKQFLSDAIKNGKVFIDGWTATINTTLQNYKENVKIVF